MTPAIELAELRKQYDPPDGAIALAGISLTVAQGEIFSLLGPNGAGKSTVIGLLCGLLRPTAGTVRVGGHDVVTALPAVKRLIGVVPQELALYEDMTGRQNLRFWGSLYGLRGARLAARSEHTLELLGLVERADDKVEHYSGGMKRRLNVGVALLHEPRILYLDEPTVGIDPQSRRALLDQVRTLNSQGVTIFYTTHYMEEAEALSHRVCVLDEGTIRAIGAPAELIQQFGGQSEVQVAVRPRSDDLLAVWERLPGVLGVRNRADDVSLTVDDPDALLPRLLETALAQQARILRVNVRAPTLETVFFRLTGKALRD